MEYKLNIDFRTMQNINSCLKIPLDWTLTAGINLGIKYIKTAREIIKIPKNK